MIKKIIKSLVYLLLFPIVYFICLIKPIKFIRFCEIFSGRFGEFISQVEGYFYNKSKYKELSDSKIIFFYGTFISNNQIKLMSERVILIKPYSFFLKLLYKAFLFYKKNDHILDLDKFNFNDSFYLVKDKRKTHLSFPHLSFTEEELEHGREVTKKLGIKPNDKWICIHNRDSLYLNHNFPNQWPKGAGSWAYHDHRNFSVESFKLASEFFAAKGFFVLRMGQVVEEKFNNNNPKIIDYANTKFRSDFMDIYLLSKCEFLLGGDSGIHLVPFVFNRPVYGINYTLSLLWQVHKLYLQLFIFKRINNLETGKLLTAKEILKSDFAHSYSDLSVKYNMQTINNNEEDIKCLTSEIDRQIKGEEIFDKEDLKINDEFWKIYEKFSDKKIIGPLKPKISPSFLRNNLDLLN